MDAGKQAAYNPFKPSAPRAGAKARGKNVQQAPTISGSTSTSAPANRYYEESSLKVPLYSTNGKKRQNARASSSLRNKSLEDVLRIVEAYSGREKRQDFENQKKPKAWIADWIEMAETVALGKSPATKLTRADWNASEFASRILGDNLGADHLAKIGTKRKTPHEDVEEEHKSPKRHQKVPPSTVQIGKQAEIKRTLKEKQIGQKKIDSTPRPANEKQTKNGLKKTHSTTHHEYRQTAPQERPPRVEDLPMSQPQRNVVDQAKKDIPLKEAPQKVAVVQPTKAKVPSYGPKGSDQALRNFVEDIGLSKVHPDMAAGVVNLGHNRARILSTTTRKYHLDESIGLHETSITAKQLKNPSAQLKHDTQPYLKPGKHGLHGDFSGDPDLATGVGHNYDPEDLQKYEEYLAFRNMFYKTHGYATYPRMQPGAVHDAGLIQEWADKQEWHRGFKAKYSGVRGDQWVCGCRKTFHETGYESEEE